MRHPLTLGLGLGLLVLPARPQDREELAPAPLAFQWTTSGGLVVPVDRPDRHAPIGVNGVHPQTKGTWLFSYRHVRTERSDLMDRDGELSDQEVFDRGFAELPTKAVRGAHLFQALYGFDERFSFLATVPWISIHKDLETAGGEEFTTRTLGMGDVRLTGLYSLKRRDDEHFHLDLGVSLPTGSLDERDTTLTSGGKRVQLPYDMQLGSGTVDLYPGLTYFRLREDTSWGAQAVQTIRLGENSEHYTLGDETQVTAWVARLFKEDLSGSLRMTWLHTESIDGADPRLDPKRDPSSDPNAYGGERLDVFVGFNYTRPGGHRFAGEIGGSIYQELDGPQLKTGLMYLFGWQYSF